MAQRLTWQNIEGPSFAGPNQMYKLSADLLNQGLDAAGKTLDTYQKDQTQSESAKLMMRVAQQQDPEALSQALSSGAFLSGVNPAYINPQAIDFLNRQRSNLYQTEGQKLSNIGADADNRFKLDTFDTRVRREGLLTDKTAEELDFNRKYHPLQLEGQGLQNTGFGLQNQRTQQQLDTDKAMDPLRIRQAAATAGTSEETLKQTTIDNQRKNDAFANAPAAAALANRIDGLLQSGDENDRREGMRLAAAEETAKTLKAGGWSNEDVTRWSSGVATRASAGQKGKVEAAQATESMGEIARKNEAIGLLGQLRRFTNDADEAKRVARAQLKDPRTIALFEKAADEIKDSWKFTGGVDTVEQDQTDAEAEALANKEGKTLQDRGVAPAAGADLRRRVYPGPAGTTVIQNPVQVAAPVPVAVDEDGDPVPVTSQGQSSAPVSRSPMAVDPATPAGRYPRLSAVTGRDGGVSVTPEMQRNIETVDPNIGRDREISDAFRNADRGIYRDGPAPSNGGDKRYDVVLGNGRYGTPPKPVSTMTIAEANQFGKDVLIPNSRDAGVGKTADGRIVGSSAMGKYQFIGSTMMAAARQIGLDPNTTVMTPEVQDRLALQVVKTQGLTAWEGLTKDPNKMAIAKAALAAGDDKALLAAIANPESGAGKGDPTVAANPLTPRESLTRAVFPGSREDLAIRAAQASGGSYIPSLADSSSRVVPAAVQPIILPDREGDAQANVLATKDPVLDPPTPADTFRNRVQSLSEMGRNIEAQASAANSAFEINSRGTPNRDVLSSLRSRGVGSDPAPTIATPAAGAGGKGAGRGSTSGAAAKGLDGLGPNSSPLEAGAAIAGLSDKIDADQASQWVQEVSSKYGLPVDTAARIVARSYKDGSGSLTSPGTYRWATNGNWWFNSWADSSGNNKELDRDKVAAVAKMFQGDDPNNRAKGAVEGLALMQRQEEAARQTQSIVSQSQAIRARIANLGAKKRAGVITQDEYDREEEKARFRMRALENRLGAIKARTNANSNAAAVPRLADD